MTSDRNFKPNNKEKNTMKDMSDTIRERIDQLDDALYDNYTKLKEGLISNETYQSTKKTLTKEVNSIMKKNNFGYTIGEKTLASIEVTASSTKKGVKAMGRSIKGSSKKFTKSISNSYQKALGGSLYNKVSECPNCNPEWGIDLTVLSEFCEEHRPLVHKYRCS